MTGKGDGTFNTAVAHTLPNNPRGVAVGNFFGGTGRSDFAIGYTTGDLSVVLNQAPALHITCTPASAPPVLTGVPYTINCPVTNGVAPFTYSKLTGMLPNGLSLDSSTGVISGTPTAAGTFNFQIFVVDSDNPLSNDTASVTVVVVSPLTTAVSPLPGGTIGTAYSAALFSGGTPPYSCGLSSGSYPPGLTVNGELPAT